MKRRMFTVTFTLILLLALVTAAGAQDRTGEPKESIDSFTLQSVAVNDTLSASDLAQSLVGPDVTLSNISYTGAGEGSGAFSGGAGNVGLESGVILSSGWVVDVVGPNTSDSLSRSVGTAGDADLNSLIPGYITYNAAVLEFDFECPTGTDAEDEVISFRYVFASEEYNEWVNSVYNDVFGFFLNGSNIALLPDGITPVSINNVNNGYSSGGGLPGSDPSNPSYYRNNDLNDGGPFIDIEADGLTVVLGAEATINSGVNHMRLAIADAGDQLYDSWVFIEEGSFQCAPLNSPPTADAGDAYSGDEGSPISLNGSNSSDPDGDPLTYAWSVDSPLCSFDDATSATPDLTCTDNGEFTVTLEVSDGQATDSDVAAVSVANVAPSVTIDSVSPTLLAVGESVTADGSFTDPGTNDTHTAQWEWGDGSSSGTVNGLTVGPDSHTYTAPGVYEVTLTVTDDDGGAGTDKYEDYVVVYDPEAGFVTGGGWFTSPAGAYTPDPDLSGRANFGFVSKYKKGADIPTGNTEFQFQAGDLNFHSSNYDWLVVTGSDYAMFKGTGTINGEGEYKFRIWAGDSSPDTFRIRIWEEDELGNETDVYDNGTDQAIDAGSIVLHAK